MPRSLFIGGPKDNEWIDLASGCPTICFPVREPVPLVCASDAPIEMSTIKTHSYRKQAVVPPICGAPGVFVFVSESMDRRDFIKWTKLVDTKMEVLVALFSGVTYIDPLMN